MKKLCFLVIIILITPALFAQITKSLPLTSPGTLASVLTGEELSEVTDLTISGNIDARDFKTMRDLMPVLANIDLNDVTVAAYSGAEGTSKSGNLNYTANTVPESAFQGKSSLSKIVLPAAVYEISAKAFLSCSGLQTVTLPSSLQTINDQAFGWCYILSSIALPESLNYIGYQAFATTNLSVIDIPKAVDFIGDVVFSQCRKLQEINVSALNAKYSSVNGVLFNKNQTILIAYPGGKTAPDYNIPTGVTKISVRSFEGSKLTKINIPEGVLQIGFEAFTNMSSLLEINIPSSIATIEGGAFAYNKNLMSVSANRIIPLPLNGNGVFDGINKFTCLLYVPAGSANLYRNAVEWKDFQNIVSITVEVEMTYIPDDNFEQALIKLKYDVGPLDDSIPTNIARSLTTLNISNKSISDLTGIEDFTSLETLYLSGNKLASLDLSQNTKLKVLHCQNNQLTSLDISKNKSLTELAPNFNLLTKLDLSNNPALIKVFCQSNQLTELDIRNNKSLLTLICSSNQLTNLNVSDNNALAFLACDNNKIESLDLSNNKSLMNLLCNKNNLYKLNIQNGNNANMIGSGKGINASDNCGLLCIQVDDPSLAVTYTNWQKDPQTSYSTFCNNAPTANAGANHTADVNTLVMLDGSGSVDFEGDSISYQWHSPEQIILSSSTVVKPTFIAPNVLKDTTLLFTLTVSDKYKTSSIDSVYITIKQINKAPIANAGSNIRINELSSAVISGSRSTDPENSNLSFRWIVPNTFTTESLNLEELIIIAPEVQNDITFMIELIVNDGILDSEPDRISITIVNVNKEPVAIAGSNKVADENSEITIDGSESFDFEGEQLIYQWVSPDNIVLNSLNISKPSFTAPEVFADTVLFFVLTVSDGIDISNPDTLYVNVKQVNKTPVANAGVDQTAKENTVVALDGTGSYDFDKDALQFNWVAPADIQVNFENPKAPTFTVPAVSKDTTLLFTLMISDGMTISTADSVFVFVKNVNRTPVANAGSNQVVAGNSVVHIDGSQSNDPDGDNISYLWTAPSGIELSSYNSFGTSVIMPDVESPTDFVLGLMVTDGVLFSEKVEIIITVLPQTAEVHLSASLNNAAVPASLVKYDFYIEKGDNYEWQEISPIKEGNNSKFGLAKGNWIIMVSPVSNDFPFIPTYFGDKLNWKDAQLIEISDYSLFSGIINCQPADTVEADGEFTIKGYITQTSGNKSGVYYNGKIEGSPLEGIVVYLYQEGKQVPFNFNITDEDGFYTFSNIPGGNYFISVELPGFEPENEFKISLENSSPLVSEMNFNVIKGTGVITGINEFENKIHFYPNPFDNEIRIVSPTDAAKVIIFNSKGQTIKTISNPNSIIQAEFLKPGIYFISVFDTDNRLLETGKLVKNR